MTWNTLDVPLETGWQCTLIPAKQYDSMMRRGYDDQQLAEDRRIFAGYFRPNLDLRSITGENALRTIQTYARNFLNLAHWNLPTDNAGIRKLLCDAVACGRLVPVVNREYSGLPRVAQPDPAPERWPATLDPLPNLGAPVRVGDDDFDLPGIVESAAGALLGGGDDGQPVVDFDFDHDHGQGVPHAHNWDNGARGPGVAFSPL